MNPFQSLSDYETYHLSTEQVSYAVIQRLTLVGDSSRRHCGGLAAASWNSDRRHPPEPARAADLRCALPGTIREYGYEVWQDDSDLLYWY